jgi:hypothetical protein
MKEEADFSQGGYYAQDAGHKDFYREQDNHC